MINKIKFLSLLLLLSSLLLVLLYTLTLEGLVGLVLTWTFYLLAAFHVVATFRINSLTMSAWENYRSMYSRIKALDRTSAVPLVFLTHLNRLIFIVLILSSFLWNKKWLPLAVFSLALWMYNIARLRQPPFVLLLANSNDENTRLLQYAFTVSTRPYQALSLLKLESRPGIFNAYVNSFSRRTHNVEKWQPVAFDLIEFAKLVVLDTRKITPSVLQEAVRLAESGMAFKTVLIVGKDDNHPVLDALEPQAIVDLMDAARFKEHEVVAFVRRLAMNPKNAPTRDAPVIQHITLFDEEIIFLRDLCVLPKNFPAVTDAPKSL